LLAARRDLDDAFDEHIQSIGRFALEYARQLVPRSAITALQRSVRRCMPSSRSQRNQPAEQQLRSRCPSAERQPLNHLGSALRTIESPAWLVTNMHALGTQTSTTVVAMRSLGDAALVVRATDGIERLDEALTVREAMLADLESGVRRGRSRASSRGRARVERALADDGATGPYAVMDLGGTIP
jgi:hypothetical protein